MHERREKVIRLGPVAQVEVRNTHRRFRTRCKFLLDAGAYPRRNNNLCRSLPGPPGRDSHRDAFANFVCGRAP